MPSIDGFLCETLIIADILPPPPPHPVIPGTESVLPSGVFVAMAGTMISLAVLVAAVIATKKHNSRVAGVGFVFLAVTVCATVASVIYTSVQHAARAEAIAEQRRNYSGPPEQPQDWPEEGPETAE
ncbi:MAG TPA: hypothetical protein EYG03_16655 [Planctomycetes bacterium]|nr:hypothetical protein [Fuerstiella sp.]HIK93581.1 hypothetical protein [Planctomycetota bacterium]